MNPSLIISIYKSPDFLNRVLASVARQSASLHEIIITEDGLFIDNAQVIETWRKRVLCPVKHLTQTDLGNRKPLALNRALACAESDYLVFIDGDCVLRSDFVQAHLDFADERAFLTGRRVELSPEATEWMTAERIYEGYLNTWTWDLYRDALFGSTQYLGRMFRTPSLLRTLFRQNRIDDIRGCNFSVHRKHLLAINGFSNQFSGAYGEDSDVEHRLKFLGLRMKSVKGAAIQFHLWHPTQTKDLDNQERLSAVLKAQECRTTNGLAEISSHPA
jgi:glycosyltransferase involved in cell wall biosynthesis